MSMVITVKAIKPRKLKVDAIRLEILNALRAEGRVHKKELEKTVRTWRNKPQFETLIGLGGGDATAVTGPTGNADAVNHWVWANEGTPTRIIRARRAPYLRFRGGNIPKTAPGQFTSRVGGKVGKWARKKSVRHKIRARNWTPILSKRRRGPFTKRMIKAMQVGARKV